ncbi:unnamed protein product [Tilletia controversa]|nr:unnamed protein product [Tilletia controversa]CAD6931259.1 unnamed protein product [Tilletia controversa]CAD6962442.1 unnamed protein product [Tilletia controversa]
MQLSQLAIAIVLPALVAAVPTDKRSTIATGLVFASSSDGPLSQSATGGGMNNGTLQNGPVVAGKAFDRITHIWLENTNAAVAFSTPAFMNLASKGLTLTSSYAVTHPSEPNYISSVVGDYFGLADDSFNRIPTNVTSVFDLLDEKAISWACYQEQLPTTGYTGFNYTQKAYIEGSATWTYYVRKHNPCAILDRVSGNATLRERNRNFNDFAADASADALPQWMFMTPNMVNDGHDTSPAFFSNWTDFFLLPLLNNTAFNNNRSLIVLSFDENEDYTVNNQVATIILGNGLPQNLVGTEDDTYYTHYSFLSTVEANWGLKTLGRGDVNKTMSNVLSFVANVTGYQNVNVPVEERPLTNLTGVAPGPLSADLFTEFYAPPQPNVIGAGGQAALILPGLNVNQVLTESTSTTNLTATGGKRPYGTDPFASSSAVSATSTSAAVAQLRTGTNVHPVMVAAALAVFGGALATLL